MRSVVHGYLFAVLLTVAWGGAAVADELKIPGGCVAADSAKPGPAGYADRVIHEKTGIELILMPAGTFTIGTDDPNAASSPRPARQVTVTRPFYIGKTEVTNGQYRRFMGARPDYDGEADVDPAYDLYLRHMRGKSVMSDADEYPVVYVSWHNAKAFCQWAGLALPGEAQWEYACRAGTRTAYSFGDDTDMIDDYAWHYGNSSEKYQELGQKKPNPWGLYDMHGNVSEWTLDQYQKDAYATMAKEMADEINPWIRPTALHPRTVRGGSWDDDVEEHRCASRIPSSFKWKERDPQIPKSYWWNTDSPFVGFRLVRPVKQPSKEEQAEFWMSVLGG